MKDRRNKAVVIRFTEDEWKALNEKVRKAKMPRETFVREILMGAKVNAPPDADYISLISEVRRIGININQLTKEAHCGNIDFDWLSLEQSLEENHRVSELLCETFKKVEK